MTTTSQRYTQEVLELAGSKVELVRGGAGEPLVIFHDEIGHPGWMRYHESLAQSNTLYIPMNPGAGQSEDLDWVRNMRDLAIFQLEVLEDLGLDRVNAIGLSFGGWLAAEMAAMSPERFKKLVLVNPMGILPPSGEILDMFMVVAKEFITKSFLDPGLYSRVQRHLPRGTHPRAGRALGAGERELLPHRLEAIHVCSDPTPLAQEAFKAAHPDHLRPAGCHHARQRRRSLPPVHPGFQAGGPRQLRPPPRDREDRRVPQGSAGLSLGGRPPLS